jgi:hypothetical protein
MHSLDEKGWFHISDTPVPNFRNIKTDGYFFRGYLLKENIFGHDGHFAIGCYG